MGRISRKLVIGFGTLILIISVVMVLTSVISREATATYDTLKTEIGPAINMLGQFKKSNTELLLLSLNKIIGQSDETFTNRMKAITEVELPHLKTEIHLLKQSMATNDARAQLVDSIILSTNSAIAIVNDVNILLYTSNDYNDPTKLARATSKVKDELTILSSQIDRGIARLQNDYSDLLDTYQEELSQELHMMSNFILFVGLFGIVFGLSIAFRIIRSIAGPIRLLQISAKRISAGNYNITIPVKGKGELASLGNSFNQMADSLKKNFDEINYKNKELERFVYIASHDLQEPLRTINSFTDLFEKEYKGKLDGDGITYLKFISEAATRMSNLVKGLLDYSRIGRSKKQSIVDCNTLLREVQVDLAYIIEESNAQLSIGDLPEIQGYATELRMVFQNLITNAIKFSKPDIAPRISINAKKEGDYWKFAVQDQGIGIEDQFKEKIFTIFLRLHGNSEIEGTGIGLAHCHKIIELHGGKIWVDSRFGEGSTFYFTIENKQL